MEEKDHFMPGESRKASRRKRAFGKTRGGGILGRAQTSKQGLEVGIYKVCSVEGKDPEWSTRSNQKPRKTIKLSDGHTVTPQMWPGTETNHFDKATSLSGPQLLGWKDWTGTIPHQGLFQC